MVGVLAFLVLLCAIPLSAFKPGARVYFAPEKESPGPASPLVVGPPQPVVSKRARPAIRLIAAAYTSKPLARSEQKPPEALRAAIEKLRAAQRRAT